MKRMIMLVVGMLMLTSTCFAATTLTLARSDDEKFYINHTDNARIYGIKNSLVRYPDNTVSLRIISILKPQGVRSHSVKGVYSIDSLMKFNCTSRRYQILLSTVYNKGGKVLKTIPPGQPMISEPGSMTEELTNAACYQD